MSTIHFKLTTTATPEQFIAGLTDFGPGREKLFGNSTDQYLKVHKLGSNYADVTEGSRGIWERLRYDWSDPKHIVLTTTDSNLWGGRSGHTYTLTRQPNGTTDIDVVIVREGKNFKGRLVGAFLQFGTEPRRCNIRMSRSYYGHRTDNVPTNLEIQMANPCGDAGCCSRAGCRPRGSDSAGV